MSQKEVNSDILEKIFAFISLFTSIKFFSNKLSKLDFGYELKRNKQLAEADEKTKETVYDGIHENTLRRGRILRQKTGSSVLILIVAGFIAFAFAIVFGRITFETLGDTIRKIKYPAFSIFFFALGTLGRIGWQGQSYKGNTIYERIDNFILWSTYFLGMLFGILSLILV